MFQILNGSDLRAYYGVQGIASLSGSPNRYGALVFAFTALAAGGSTTVTKKIDTGLVFIGDDMTGAAYISTADTAPVGTELVRDAAATKAGNNMPTYALVGVKLSTTGGQWIQERAPWPTVVGTAGNPYVFHYKPVVAAGNELKAEIFNDTPNPISGALVINGHYLAV